MAKTTFDKSTIYPDPEACIKLIKAELIRGPVSNYSCSLCPLANVKHVGQMAAHIRNNHEEEYKRNTHLLANRAEWDELRKNDLWLTIASAVNKMQRKLAFEVARTLPTAKYLTKDADDELGILGPPMQPVALHIDTAVEEAQSALDRLH